MELMASIKFENVSDDTYYNNYQFTPFTFKVRRDRDDSRKLIFNE